MVKDNASSASSPVEDVPTRTCRCCERKLPITEFDKHGKSKIYVVCRNCKNTVKKGKTIASYTTQEILRELRDRGVKGTFTYTRTETIEL